MADSRFLDLLQASPDFIRNPYPAYAELRAQGPAHRVRPPAREDSWLVVGHTACRDALADPRFSRDWHRNGQIGRIIQADEDNAALTHMLLRDPPDHTRLRKLVAKEFSMRRVDELRPRIQQLTDELLDAMLDSPTRQADLIASFALPLPLRVICELLGIPAADQPAFSGWSNEIVARTSPEAEQRTYAELTPYLAGLIAAKRNDPGDDLISALIHTVDDDDGRLTEAELIGTCMVLVVAGHETTVNLIGNGVRALLAHPGQLALLRSDLDGLLPGAIEEMLRYDGPVETSTPRLTREPVEVSGCVIPAGETVRMGLASAGRDPDRFADPDRFDITRNARGHMAFGHGIHYCLGAPLARLESQIALRALLERCPQLTAVVPEEELPWVEGFLVRGVRSLPVRW